MLGEHKRVAIAQLLDQARRPLNVREEKRDRTAWYLMSNDAERVTAEVNSRRTGS